MLFIVLGTTQFACFSLFFFNDTATTEIYTLSLHDALPIFPEYRRRNLAAALLEEALAVMRDRGDIFSRSEEHTSELQSRPHLVCRLLLEKKKKKEQDHDHLSKPASDQHCSFRFSIFLFP